MRLVVRGGGLLAQRIIRKIWCNERERAIHTNGEVDYNVPACCISNEAASTGDIVTSGILYKNARVLKD